jgi:hypothetical protein
VLGNSQADAMDVNVMHMLGELKGLLQSVVTRLDGLEAARLRDTQEIHSRIDKQESRIQSLENAKNQAAGAALATKVIVPLVWGLVMTFGGLIVYLLSPIIVRAIDSHPSAQPVLWML